TQGNGQKSRILVLVKYSDIEEIRKTHPKQTVTAVKKDKYKKFNPTNLAEALVKFNKDSGLPPLMLQGIGKPVVSRKAEYETVLKSQPVKIEYKNTGMTVETWNLIIYMSDGKPLDKNKVEKIQKLVEILKDHGVAVRREKDLKLK
ncbi:MAG: hypothetical protein J6K87_01690, partial [Clostridia bacterium]|nr:hypothetical protein [Clostridia bacterium]